MQSSQAAFDLIVSEEVTDAAFYARHYQNFDWPAGASGPTIGVGYDCGYVTAAEARADWAGFVGPVAVAAIVLACGLKGEAAHAFVQQHRGSVTVSWPQAIAQFSQVEMGKWEALVRAALPNTDALTADCFGVLVSLSYNRGCSYDLPGARFAEMRAIKAHMAAQEFGKIPTEILAMRRLWPAGEDLWNRRGHEAALFARGLNPPGPA